MTITQLRIDWERTFAMDRISLRRARRVLLLETPLPSGLTGVNIQQKPPQVDAVAGGRGLPQPRPADAGRLHFTGVMIKFSSSYPGEHT